MHRPHFVNFRATKELKEVYYSILLRAFAIGMIAIFVPLYFLNELNYSLKSVLFYYITLFLLFGAFAPLSAKISAKLGSKHTILTSIPLYLIYLAMLYSIVDYNWPLYVVAGASALANSLFWVAYNIDFTCVSNKKHRGEQVGVQFFLQALFGLTGPIIGGLIVVYFGFKVLFGVVSVLMFGSAIPLLFSQDIHVTTDFSFRHIFKKSHFKDILSFVGVGMRDGAAGIIWPIFIFLVVGSYFTLGGIITISGVIGAFYYLLIGKFSDKLNKKKLIRLGTVLHSITWYTRGFVESITTVLGINIISHLTFSTFDVPYNAIIYDKASKTNIPEYNVFKEMGISLGHMMIYTLLLITGSMIFSFITAGFATYLLMLL
ncbi:MAG: MFS transporter [Candidatus Nanoarchaeia archaeon]|nr:MFS transporter [Candidatus Nanoarchaeia archaeon]